MKSFLCAVAAFGAIAAVAGGEETVRNPSVRYIQRTMKKMAGSTAERPVDVKLLFYGQSIVEQGWHRHVLETLRERYPTVRFEVKNLAIGGFESPLLIRTAESDLYPEYADLVFFHDYGPTEHVRTMIERLRARTTSEVVMWTSHLKGGDDVESGRAESDRRSKELIRIAEDNHCMMIHLRRRWADVVASRFGGKPGKLLLPDGVHLNESAKAFRLYAKILTDELVRLDGQDGDEMSGRIVTTPFRQAVKGNPDGSFDFAFDGNRVVVETGDFRGYYNSSPTKVLLDGREMRGMKELYRHGRVSSMISWMPLVLCVRAETVPVEETWTLTFLEGSDPKGSRIRYRVDGTVTGFDGEGTSESDFVSKSGRVKILAKDFHLWQYDYFATKRNRPDLYAKPGQWTCWNTVRQFNDILPTYSQGHEKILIATGMANGPHVLTFVPSVRSRPPELASITVYTPYGHEKARGEECVR